MTEHHNNESEKPKSSETAWAKPVSQLTVAGLPMEAVNLNVQGKRLARPVELPAEEQAALC